MYRIFSSTAIISFTLSISTSVFANGLGVGAGQDQSGKIFFVHAKGKNSQEALDAAREICISKYNNCTPLAQIDEGCVAIVVGFGSSGKLEFYRGKDQQEALMSCWLGGANCVPPLESFSQCVD